MNVGTKLLKRMRVIEKKSDFDFQSVQTIAIEIFCKQSGGWGIILSLYICSINDNDTKREWKNKDKLSFEILRRRI